MMLTAYRIVRPAYTDEAFTGEGARIDGGRWNSPGHSVVYTAATLSLATLELLVRMPRRDRIRQFAVVTCWFPEAIVDEIDRKVLPEDWREYPPPPQLQTLGDQWLESRASVVLAVPSSVIDTELNFLINPEHPDFSSVDIGEPRDFTLDARLFI